MKTGRRMSFGQSRAFRYAMIAIGISTLYVILSFFLENRLGVEEAHPFIIQISPAIFGMLAFVIGHKEDRYREANERAATDFLTGLANHSTFQERLKGEISRSVRYGRPLSLLMLDLDHFKNVNDDFGHPMGDEVLRCVGSFLQEDIRRSDFAARYGGEEFVVIMPEVDGAEAASSAERLRSRIRKIAGDVDIPKRYVSVSIGVGDCPMCAVDGDSLIAVADSALLFAKRKGRNRVAYFRDLRDVELQKGDIMRLSHRLEGATLQSFKALVSAVESLELYEDATGRLDDMAGDFAARLGMDDSQTDILILASQLHDLGKVGIPGSILNKKEQLEPDELALVKLHPEMGRELLQEIIQINELINAILYHHERWDGKGYPEGLKGENIPLMARIVALLDSYRAMVSERPYSPAMELPVVIDELRRGAGTQFDPGLVETFADLLEDDEMKAVDQNVNADGAENVHKA